MSKIFISYRREDSGYVAEMLTEALEDRFGEGAVFFDIDSAPFGVDFREHINGAVEQCDIFLAVMGNGWVNATNANGTRRIDLPTDYVRLEVEAALARNIPVVPVLVGSAEMPKADDLPESLRPLVYRNAAEVRSGRDLSYHLEVLTNGIASLLNEAGGPGAESVAHVQPVTDRVYAPPDDATGLSKARSSLLAVAVLLNALGGWGPMYLGIEGVRRWLDPIGILQAVPIIYLAYVRSGGLVPRLSFVLALTLYAISFGEVVRWFGRGRDSEQAATR